ATTTFAGSRSSWPAAGWRDSGHHGQARRRDPCRRRSPSRHRRSGFRRPVSPRMRLAREPLPWHVSAPYLRDSSGRRKRSMANRETTFIEITPEVLLKAYACGIFPMAESAEDPALYWLEPEMRGVIPLDRFHMPSRLARTRRSDRFTVTLNPDSDGVPGGRADPRPGRPRTWINTRIRVLYRKLYERRHCHSLEVYEGEALVGGLYGVTLGRAFFGESMFHRARDASKVALVHLVARLKAGGFKLLDTQFVTDHLRSFGAIEVPRRQYHRLLEAALTGEGDFAALDTKRPVTGAQALAQLTTDRSSRG